MDVRRMDGILERAIQGAVLIALVWAPLFFGAVGAPEFFVVQVLVVVALVLWVARLWLNRNHRLLWIPVCWSVLAFVGYALVRYRQADLEYVARGELIRVLLYMALFFLAVNNLHRQEATHLFVLVMVFLALAISAYAVYQFATDSEHVLWAIKPASYRHRGSGTYICPNHLAGFLEMILPLGLAFTLTGRLSHLTKVLLGYASLVILAGLGVTVSRGGWLACGLSLVVFFAVLLRRRDFRLPVLVTLAALLVMGTVFLLKTEQIQKRLKRSLAAGTVEDVQMRNWLWKPALDMWQDHPWFGVGPAHFDYRFRQYRPATVHGRPLRAHNDYLNTLADWGVVGFALVASSWVMVCLGILKTWRFVDRTGNDLTTKMSNRSAFVLGGSCGLLAILVHSAFDFNLHIPANAMLTVTLMALVASHLRFTTDRYWFTLRWWTRSLVTLVAAAGVLYLAQVGWRRFREDRWHRAADRAGVTLADRIRALEEAQTLEPTNAETVYELGETLRLAAWEGGPDAERRIHEAMGWFERGMKLAPYDPYNFLRYGMCLDWLGRGTEASEYVEKAVALDPNNYYIAALEGWHLLQVEDYQAAERALERSRRLKWWDNPIADAYLRLVRRARGQGAGVK